jgi:hypothetical protein
MNINAGNPSLQNIVLHNMKEKRRPTFSAVFEKLNKRTAQMNSKSPLNSVLTNEQLFRYYVKDTMPQLDKSNDTFGDSEQGSMMSDLMGKLGLKEKPLNGANVQTLEGTTNTLPYQMGDGSATAQGEPFVPDGRNNAETGAPKKTVFSLSDEEADDLDAAYGSGVSFVVKWFYNGYNSPAQDYDESVENASLDEIVKHLDIMNEREKVFNTNFDTNPPSTMGGFFDAIFGKGAGKKVENMVKTNPVLYSTMKFYDISKEPSFNSTSPDNLENEGEASINFLDHFPQKTRIGKSEEEDEGILKDFMEDIVYSLENDYPYRTGVEQDEYNKVWIEVLHAQIRKDEQRDKREFERIERDRLLTLEIEEDYQKRLKQYDDVNEAATRMTDNITLRRKTKSQIEIDNNYADRAREKNEAYGTGTKAMETQTETREVGRPRKVQVAKQGETLIAPSRNINTQVAAGGQSKRKKSQKI